MHLRPRRARDPAPPGPAFQRPAAGGPPHPLLPLKRPARRTPHPGAAIHQLTNRSQATNAGQYENGFYSAIHTPQVTVVRCDERGFFQVSLPPGRYSVFVREGESFYANGWDGAGNIAPVEVAAGTVTRLQVDIDYRAVH